MKFIDVAVPHFGDDETPQGSVPNPPVIDHSHHRSFRHHTIEEYNLEDDRSIMSVRTSNVRNEESSAEEEGGETFYEPRDDTTEASVRVSEESANSERSLRRERCNKSISNSPFPSASYEHRSSSPHPPQTSVPWPTRFWRTSVSPSI